MSLLLRLLLCLSVVGVVLYLLIDQQNQLNDLRREIPKLTKQWQNLEKENARLQYAVDQLANPLHLMERARDPLFEGLRFPKVDEVVVLPETPTNEDGWPEDSWEIPR